MQQKGYELITRVPQFSNLKTTLYRQRNQAHGVQQEPRSRDDINLDENTLRMTDGSSFLLGDNNEGARVLIFSSSKGRECLKTHSKFFMDGTFKSSSSQFTQLYTIHVDLGSTAEETNVAPVVFALLPNKAADTYIRLFNIIKTEIPEWNPTEINVDFEAAAIKAIKEVFPSVKVQGCFFHLAQSIWRKVQDVGLTESYKTNQEIRLVIRKCAALAFLPPEDVEEGFINIHSNAPDDDKLVQFFDYFVDQWLENSQIPLDMWNCYNRRHRTNNSVEGWHHHINDVQRRPHPRIKELVVQLKKESEKANNKIVRMELNLEGVKRKKKYSQLDTRIEKNTKIYEETRDIPRFLEVMAFIVKMD